MTRAVFLDRDGVLNLNILNPSTGQMESPHHPDDFHLFPDALNSLRRLQDEGYLLFLVSNQPSYAKGKTSLENIHAIADKFRATMDAEKIRFANYYYCLHHPDGIKEGYSGPCICRKPSPFFLQEAEKDFGVQLESSWMVGDRDTDIECGKSAGTRTILIDPDPRRTSKAPPNFKAKGLAEAVTIILSQK